MKTFKHWSKYEINLIYKKDFPEQIKNIRNCPEKLFYRGEWNNNKFQKSLAIVGSRRMTKYGESVVEKFVPELVANKYSLISGFMYGVDSEVHRKCIEFGGLTIAVLGGGLNEHSVPENDDLYSQILENNGLVISEYESEFKPTLWSFPQRNRIVSGLTTEGVLVIEAGLKSGSLITARIAKEQGKRVYAIPGQILNGNSDGTNWLIAQEQAKMIISVDELTNKKETIEQFNLFDSVDKQEKRILEVLRFEPLSLDEICRKTDLDINQVMAKMSLMTLNGLVEESAGKFYPVVTSKIR